MRLFYSWQSDVKPSRNKVSKAVERACKALNWELDYATRGAKGAVNISKSILEKIEQANVFLADVTIINSQSEESRRVPNPNVVYEAGYAMAFLKEQKMILVADRELTSDKDLPFDLRNNLILFYRESNQLSEELIRLLETHMDDADETTEDIPYIFLKLGGISSSGPGESVVKFAVENDEDKRYLLENITFGKQTIKINQSINPKGTTEKIWAPNIMYPFSEPVDKIKFVVSRGNKKFIIYQRTVLEPMAIGQYKLAQLVPSPESHSLEDKQVK